MNFGFFNLEIGSFLIGFGVVILFFLLVRVIVLWYWKVDEIVYLLKRIEINTRMALKGKDEEVEKDKEEK